VFCFSSDHESYPNETFFVVFWKVNPKEITGKMMELKISTVVS